MKEISKFFKGFYYAGSGIINTVLTERNMRVHLMFAVYMFSILGFTDWFKLTSADWVALIFCVALVIGGELVNTALEHAVDLAANEELHEHAKRAKDAAAGAVLIFALASVAIGIKILFQPEAFKAMGAYFTAKPFMLALFIVSIIAAVIFVFFGGKKKTE